MPAFPTPAHVAEVTAMIDLAGRNRQVTVGYYALSQRFRHFIPEDANWTTFATWASAQAGRTIRKEDLERALERKLGDSDVVRRLVEGPLRVGTRFLLPQLGEIARFLSALAVRAKLMAAIDVLLIEVRRLEREILTESMMVLELPGETLRLGDDLGGGICERLRQIDNPDAQALLADVDLTPNSLHGSGTDDWTALAQRLHFIADLFRSRQDRPRLFEPVA